MGKAIGGILLALVFALIATHSFQEADRLEGIPIRSAVTLQDIKPGIQVLAYGGVWADSQDNLVIHIRQEERCSTHTSTDKDGKVSTHTSCSWYEVGRTLPPFNVVMVESGKQIAIRVVNSDYRLSGTGWRTRTCGFRNGDGVLVVGTSTRNGIQASEVYGGTADAYIGGYKVGAWICVVLAVICVGGGLLFWWADM